MRRKPQGAELRAAVLEFLVGKGAVSEELRCKLLGWSRSGFSVHNQVRVVEGDAERRKKLAGCCMLRAPMALETMRYDAATSNWDCERPRPRSEVHRGKHPRGS